MHCSVLQSLEFSVSPDPGCSSLHFHTIWVTKSACIGRRAKSVSVWNIEEPWQAGKVGFCEFLSLTLPNVHWLTEIKCSINFIFVTTGRKSLKMSHLCWLAESHRLFHILTDWQRVTRYYTFETTLIKISQFHTLIHFHVCLRLLPEITHLYRLAKSDRQFHIRTHWQKVTGHFTFEPTMKKISQFHT